MKKIFNLLLGVSILMSSSTYIYANNIEESQDLNNTYTRINNYINQEKEYNLLDMTFNKYIVSILNENNDLYNIYNYKEQAPLSNINLLLTQSLIQNTNNLTILSNVSNISPTTISYIAQTFNDGDDYTDVSFRPSLHAAGVYYDSISNGYYKLYGNFWWEGTSSKTERNTSWYATPPIPNDVYKPNAVEIGSKAVLGYEVENIQWYSPSSAPTPKARPGRWTHEKRCYVNYRRALTIPQTGSISVGNAYRASNSLYWVKENASAHVNYSATQDFNGRDLAFEDYITTNYIYFAVNGNKSNSPYITNGRWAYHISNYNNNSLLSVSFKGTNADNVKGDTNRTMHSSVYVSLRNNGTEVELGGKADSANGKSSALSWSGIKIKCDAKNPTATINTTASSNSVNVQFSASDGESGLSSIQYKLSGAQNKDWTNIGNNGSISITGLGNTTVYVRATDNVGNTYETSKVVTVDTIAPTVSHTINPTGWTNRIVTINLTASDAHSGLKNITLPNNSITTSSVASYAVGANGTYTFKATDNAGNVTTYPVIITNIDKVAPAISLSQSPTGWTKNDVAVNANITETGSGIHTRKWAAGNQGVSYFTNNGTTINTNSFTVTTNGTYTFYAKDNAGNESIKTINITNIDKVAPVISLSQNPTGWTKGDVNVTAFISETGSGVSIRKWAAGSQSASYFASGGTTITSNSFTVTANGTYTFYVKDNAGNESIKTIKISNIDKVAPIISLSQSPTEWTKGDVNVTAFISETGSGVSVRKWASGNQSVSYFANGGTTINTNSFTVTANGTYTFYVKDNAGNESIKTIKISNIDKVAPIISLSQSPTEWTKGDVNVTAFISETGSGVSVRKWASGNQSVSYFANGGTTINTNSFTVTANGTYTFYVKDNAGNESVKTITISNIDKVAPIISLSQSPTGWTKGDVNVTAFISETGSGVSVRKWAAGNQSISYFVNSGTTINTNNFTVTANGIYTFYVKDRAGNEAIKTIQISNIDKVAPVISLSQSPTSWTNGNVTVTATITETGSGVSIRKWASGNQSVSYFANGGTTINTNNFTVTTNGTYTFYVKDNAGNESIKTINITNIDKIAPVISNIPANNSIYGGNATLTLSATDSGGSGMKSITLYKNNVSIATGTNTLSYIENDVGTHTYKVVAKDNAGNTTEKTFSLTVVKKPTVDSLSVVKYDYKDANSIYWVRPNVSGALQIKTQSYFPSSYGIYPTETQLGLGKLNYTNGTSSLAWATKSGTGSSGSEFATNFILNNGTNKATTSSSNNKNILNFTHNLTPKLDNSDYRLYSSGKYNNEQASFVNSNILIKTDGTAPTITETSPIPKGWTNQNVTVTFNSTDNRSGVKNNQIKYTGKNTTPNEVTLNNTNTVTFTATDTYNVTLISTDNVGNTSTKTGSFGIDKIAPTLSNIPTNNSEYLNTTTITINSSDTGGSGMKSVTLYRDSVVVNTGVNSATYTETTVGPHTYKVVAKDNAGNTTEKTFTLTINKKPTIDSLSVVKYDYKDANSIYWVRPNINGILQIQTQTSYPSSYGIYPTETQLGLGKPNYTNGTSSLAWATNSSTGYSGSEFAANFILNNGTNKATASSSSNKNILTFIHNLTPKLDNTDYRLYSSGKYKHVQSDFVNSNILLKTDGTAPTITETSPIPKGWTNKNVTVAFNSTDNRSGVKNNQIKYTGKNTAPNVITLNNTNSVTLTETDTYNVTLISTDNVGNTSQKTGSFGIDKITPTLSNIPTNNSEYLNTTTITINASDTGGSGMQSVTLYRDSVVVNTGLHSVTYTETTVGPHTYKVVAKDNAGNITEKTFTLTINKKPTVDSLSVVKYDYQESNEIYWVRPNINGILQIKTQTSYPSSYRIYPTETQLGLGKLNYTNGTSSLAWATNSGTGYSGSEFTSNFILNNGTNKATTSSSNNKNILTFTHNLTPKLDNSDYRLYSSGKYKHVQSDFVNSNILIKTDGTAPAMTITSPIPTGWTNKDVMISFTSSDNRSGVKTNQIKYIGKNTSPNEVTLNNTNNITFTNTDKYSVTLLSIDNVGNISKTSGAFGIDKINPVIGTTPSNGTKYLDMTTLTIKSTDEGGSLMKSLTLYRNNVKVTEGVDSVSYFENINGTHKFKVVAKDNAGNVTEREFTITILEDKINLITIPNNPKNLIRLEWSHQNLLNKSYTVYQKRDDESMFNVVPGTGDKFTQRVLDNKYASDITPPNIPNVSFIEETDNDVKYTILPTEDNGTTYKFYVVSKDNHGKLTQSNTATDTVKTGVKGYAYIVDGKTTTIPDKTVKVTVDVSKIVAPIQGNFDHYLHIAAIDNAGNMGPVNHILIWEAVKNNWFNQEIAKQVKKDYSNLRISDYRRIEAITLRNKNISGEIPKDIKKTINLVELDLYKNSINDISHLKNLTKLEYLELGNNRISDISTLTGLTELTDLNIYNNNVSDISVVAHMPNLERLYIHKNNITDISVVEQLNYLEEFYFEFNYINLTAPTTIRIIEKFENQGCYVVSAPQNIVRANDKDIVELNIGDEFIPTTILGLSENNIDIIGEHSILRALDINYLSSDTNIVDIQNNKLIALSEGEATITVVHKQFRNIATVSFTIKVIDPNKELVEDLEDVIIDNDDNIVDDNVTNDDNIIDDNSTNLVPDDNLTDDNSTSEGNKPSINESESNNNTDKEKIEEEGNDSTQNNANNTNNSNEEVSMIEQLE